MKRIFLLSALVVSLLFAQGVFAQGLTKIVDNVYSYVDVKNASPKNSFAANAGIVIGRDGVLVIDTLISAKEAQRFIADIRKVTDKPIKYVVDTHYHLDHSFGNAEFVKLGAAVISQVNDRKNLAEKGEATIKNAGNFGLTPDDLAGTTIAVPTLAFTDRMTIDLGGETVELIYVAPSHTSGSLLVFLPQHKLLFSGDVIFTDFHPFLAEGNLDGWIKNLDYIQTMDVTTIVPGHGPLSTKKDAAEMKAYLLAFDKKARKLAAEGKNAETISAELKKALPTRSQGEWMIPYNVKAKYQGK